MHDRRRKSGPRFGFCSICLFLAAFGCSRGGDGGDGTLVRDSAGITIVENDHTLPKWAAPWVLSDEPLLRIGSVEEDTTQLLFRVTDARRLRDGRILVVNSGSSEVMLYSPEGQLLQTIGGRGEGPGEFQSPWQAYPLQGDSILVVDLYREVAVFDPDGVYVREFHLNLPEGHLSGEGAAPVDQFGDGSLLFQGYLPQDPSWTGVRRSLVRMLRIPIDGSPAESLGEYEDQTVNYGPERRQFAFGPWAQEAAGASTMWYGPGDRFELREIGFDGSLIRLVRLDRPGRPVSEADRAQFRENYANQMDLWNPGRGEEFWHREAAQALFPDSFPAHHQLKTDPTGNVWVQNYESRYTQAPADRTWSVFDPEGSYLGDVVVPGGLSVQHIGQDHVVGRWTDDLGIEYVHVYGIEKQGG